MWETFDPEISMCLLRVSIVWVVLAGSVRHSYVSHSYARNQGGCVPANWSHIHRLGLSDSGGRCTRFLHPGPNGKLLPLLVSYKSQPRLCLPHVSSSFFRLRQSAHQWPRLPQF